MGGGLLLGPVTSAGSEVANELESHVAVVQTPSGAGGDCLPGILGMSNTTKSDADMFQLTIKASVDPCEPVTAHAVVYAMPGNGLGAWPQTLLEKETFTISEAGTTVVTFSKDCGPMQFDVLTGATPNVIAPDGAHHGPLLFPLDTSTAQQFFGKPGCAEVLGSTTIPETVTTMPDAVASTTTTSTPAEVLGSSTTVPEEPETTTTGVGSSDLQASPTTEVLGNSAVRSLAVTGSSNGEMALIGGGMILAGLGLVVSSRRQLA